MQLDPHHVYRENFPALPSSPALAIQRLRGFQHVGLTDLYALSWCLLQFKLNASLPELCFDHSANMSLTRYTHHEAPRSLRMGPEVRVAAQAVRLLPIAPCARAAAYHYYYHLSLHHVGFVPVSRA